MPRAAGEPLDALPRLEQPMARRAFELAIGLAQNLLEESRVLRLYLPDAAGLGAPETAFERGLRARVDDQVRFPVSGESANCGRSVILSPLFDFPIAASPGRVR